MRSRDSGGVIRPGTSASAMPAAISPTLYGRLSRRVTIATNAATSRSAMAVAMVMSVVTVPSVSGSRVDGKCNRRCALLTRLTASQERFAARTTAEDFATFREG